MSILANHCRYPDQKQRKRKVSLDSFDGELSQSYGVKWKKCGSSRPARESIKNGSIVEIKGVGSKKCLDVKGSSLEPSANVQQYKCHGGKNQRFKVKKKGNSYQLKSVRSGHCLDIAHPDWALRGSLVQYNCKNKPNQFFKLLKQGNGYMIKSDKTDLCLNVKDASRRNGANVLQYFCHGRDNQIFKIKKVR